MNRYSRVVTQPKDQGASQVWKSISMFIAFLQVDYSYQAMLYATDEITSDADFNKAMVGVASVW